MVDLLFGHVVVLPDRVLVRVDLRGLGLKSLGVHDHEIIVKLLIRLQNLLEILICLVLGFKSAVLLRLLLRFHWLHYCFV